VSSGCLGGILFGELGFGLTNHHDREDDGRQHTEPEEAVLAGSGRSVPCTFESVRGGNSAQWKMDCCAEGNEGIAIADRRTDLNR
jgi:hypothetical protein